MPPDNRTAVQAWKVVKLVVAELDQLGGFHGWWKSVPIERQSVIMGEIVDKVEELLT